jgi:hypothetical protein
VVKIQPGVPVALFRRYDGDRLSLLSMRQTFCRIIDDDDDDGIILISLSFLSLASVFLFFLSYFFCFLSRHGEHL